MAPVAVRYIVDHVEEAIAFYTGALGFGLDWAPVTHDPVGHPSPVFAGVSRGDLRLLLTSPESPIVAASDRPRVQPGGWNRAVLYVGDLDDELLRLRAAGVVVRHDVITGPGGRQAVVEDPSGNPIELFQPHGPAPSSPAV